jgi:hypothetical protein
MIPCGHTDPKAHATACRLCYLYLSDPAYRRLWDGPLSAGPKSAKRELPCVHRGADVRDERGRPVMRTAPT